MAQIIKIIETTLETGATTLTVTDAAIPYSIIAVNCDKYGTYPADMTVSGNVLTLTYEAQTEDLHLAISLIKSDLAVIDDLTSESQTDALSAAQGKALKSLIDNIVVTGTLADLDDVDLTGLTAGDILVYDAVNQKWINSKSPDCNIIINTSGQFNTITGGLLQSCNITLIPVQSGSGTPSPSNVRPITGHTAVEVTNVGKNRLIPNLSSTSQNGVTLTVKADGTYVLNGTASATCQFYNSVSGLTPTKIGQSYIMTGCPSGGGNSTFAIRPMKTTSDYYSDDIGSGSTFTASASSVFINIIIRSGYVCNNLEFKPMLRLASETDSTFEPYNPSSKQYTVALGQTVYGGSLDVVSGVLTVNRRYLLADGVNVKCTGGYGGGTERLPAINISSAKGMSNNNLIGSYLVYNVNAELENNRNTMLIFSSGEYIALHINDIRGVGSGTPYANNSELYAAANTYLQSNNLQICYPLATPLTIQLTPQQIETLIGENNVSVSLTGQSLDSLSYREMMAWNDVEKTVENYVEANPSGPSTGTLTKIKIGGTIYGVSGGGFNYSTTEHVIGTWIDGSDLYERTINAGALPNNSTKNVEMLTNIADVIDIEGFIYDNEGYFRPLPFAADSTNTIRVDVNSNVLRITTYTDWSGYVGAYITIRYTKTS